MCNTKNSIAEINAPEVLEVRGEMISVNTSFLRCQECGEEYYDTRENNDFFNLAYREYRDKHNMIQPEELKNFRKEYDLTQQELTRLLGWGGATVSRYENGALQDEAHDKTLRLAMDPKNLKRLIHENHGALPKDKQNVVLKIISAKLNQEEGEISVYFNERFGDYPSDEFSGYQQLNVKKIINGILFLCSGAGELKTKLNKLLFYADFLHFKKNGRAITGAQYIRLQYGPVLDNYEYYFASLIHENQSIRIEEKEYKDFVGEIFIANNQPEIDVFEPSEIVALASVKDYFKDFNASEISAKAHQEKGYRETKELSPISYEYAKSINLDRKN